MTAVMGALRVASTVAAYWGRGQLSQRGSPESSNRFSLKFRNYSVSHFSLQLVVTAGVIPLLVFVATGGNERQEDTARRAATYGVGFGALGMGLRQHDRPLSGK